MYYINKFLLLIKIFYRAIICCWNRKLKYVKLFLINLKLEKYQCCCTYFRAESDNVHACDQYENFDHLKAKTGSKFFNNRFLKCWKFRNTEIKIYPYETKYLRAEIFNI